MPKPEQLNEAFLIQEHNEPQFFHFVTHNIEIVAFTAVAPEKTTPNEDCLALIPLDTDTSILAIADGAGGTRQGGEASKLAVTVLKDVFSEPHETMVDVRPHMLTAFEWANQSIMALGVGANTTLAAIEINGHQMRPYHAGDSMIMVVGQRGKIKHQSIPHSPTGYAVEAGLLGENAALHHEDRHLVTNMLGNEDLRIEIGPVIKLSVFDTIVIGSDGLYDNLYIDEISDRIRTGPLLKTAENLARFVNQRMVNENTQRPSKADDLSFILIRPLRKKVEAQ